MSDYPYGAPASQGPNQPTEQRPTPPTPGHMGGDAPQTPPNFSPEKPKREKKPHRTLKTLLVGLLGGVLGAGALMGALYLAGIIGPSSTHVVGGDATQQITIDPADEDTTVANAVAAKALLDTDALDDGALAARLREWDVNILDWAHHK